MTDQDWFEKLAAANAKRVAKAKKRKRRTKPLIDSPAEADHYPPGAYEDLKRKGII